MEQAVQSRTSEDPTLMAARLMYKFAEALDRRDWRQLEECFTPDVEIESPVVGTIRGADAFVRSVRPILLRLDATQHYIANVTVNQAEGGFLASTYYEARHRRGPRVGGEVFTTGGIYVDRLVVTEGSWRIRHRVTERIWETGDASILTG